MLKHPEPFDPLAYAVFDPGKMAKVELFRSPRVLIGLNCFRPGQEHALHAHAGMDKAYYVLEGQGVFLLPGREAPLRPGMMLVAPEGVPHGIRNSGQTDLCVLTILAPAPEK
jgi:mannose-6-phosphate isomerase-like protein (cupin superfamily)